MRLATVRSGQVESTHDVSVVITDAAGDVIASWGEDLEFFYRSAIKPCQATVTREAGADLTFIEAVETDRDRTPKCHSTTLQWHLVELRLAFGQSVENELLDSPMPILLEVHELDARPIACLAVILLHRHSSHNSCPGGDLELLDATLARKHEGNLYLRFGRDRLR